MGLRGDVNSTLVDVAYRNMAFGLVIQPAAMVVLFLTLRDVAPAPLLHAWLGFALAVNILRPALYAAFRQMRPEAAATEDGEQKTTTIAVLPAEEAACRSRLSAMGVEFSRSYSTASEVVVTRSDDDELNTMQDLAGRRFAVRRSAAMRSTSASGGPTR